MTRMQKTNIRSVTIALFVATFLTAIEGTIVSTAMPTIVSDLKGTDLMNWVFAIYLLTSAVTVPIFEKTI
jgi:MFS family permease